MYLLCICLTWSLERFHTGLGSGQQESCGKTQRPRDWMRPGAWGTKLKWADLLLSPDIIMESVPFKIIWTKKTKHYLERFLSTWINYKGKYMNPVYSVSSLVWSWGSIDPKSSAFFFKNLKGHWRPVGILYHCVSPKSTPNPRIYEYSKSCGTGSLYKSFVIIGLSVPLRFGVHCRAVCAEDSPTRVRQSSYAF